MAQLQDLPAWVQFPDTERVEWLNKVIHQLWPYVGEYTKTFMNDFIIPQVKVSTFPAFITYILCLLSVKKCSVKLRMPPKM